MLSQQNSTCKPKIFPYPVIKFLTQNKFFMSRCHFLGHWPFTSNFDSKSSNQISYATAGTSKITLNINWTILKSNDIFPLPHTQEKQFVAFVSHQIANRIAINFRDENQEIFTVPINWNPTTWELNEIQWTTLRLYYDKNVNSYWPILKEPILSVNYTQKENFRILTLPLQFVISI